MTNITARASYYFSPSRCEFFAGEFQESYVKSGSWPDDAIAVTDEEFEAYAAQAHGKPKDKILGSTSSGRPAWVERPIAPIFRLANRQRAAIESALANALRAGMPYTLPDGSEDVIQTRPDEDEANLLGLAIEARDRRAAGDTEANMALRAQSNTVYSLTPEQMIALTDAAKAFKQGLLAKSWQLKDAITAAEAAGDREAIQAVRWEPADNTEADTAT
ncbi:DUF4376 domain-containing protein [Salinicola endophyticus]|uniref:DUF4376 domain-containing protein n=1 Tax=Salinicola endophyticus TaxID=1949083 RepID=A0AB74UG23_9GAMM